MMCLFFPYSHYSSLRPLAARVLRRAPSHSDVRCWYRQRCPDSDHGLPLRGASESNFLFLLLLFVIFALVCYLLLISFVMSKPLPLAFSPWSHADRHERHCPCVQDGVQAGTTPEDPLRDKRCVNCICHTLLCQETSVDCCRNCLAITASMPKLMPRFVMDIYFIFEWSIICCNYLKIKSVGVFSISILITFK